MNVHLAYGKRGLDVSLPDGAQVTLLEPRYVPGLPDEEAAMRVALRQPAGTRSVSDLVSPDTSVAIVFSDLTRPQPRKRMLSLLLAEIGAVPSDQIVLINGLATHRPNSDAELREMLGNAIPDRYRVIQHQAANRDSVVCIGKTRSGRDAWINREYLEADVKILTGLIEPHFFAGFSGGPKAVMPAVSGAELIMDNHSGQMLSDPNATWGVTHGNPVWEEMLEVAQMTKPDFLFNVALNRDKQITGVFAGDLVAAHRVGIAHIRESAMVPVDEPFDVALTTNAGYPLDLDLYQTVKGISAAAQVVRKGGAILAASSCWDGVPSHGNYKRLLWQASSPQELWDHVTAPDFRAMDQWQALLHARLCLRTDIHLYADGLSDEQIRRAKLTPCRDIEGTLERLVSHYGPRLCVLPQGPMTIPYLHQSS